LIAIRRARAADAEAVGGATVAAWRSAYAGVLPTEFLAGMSARRQAAMWRSTILEGGGGHATFVAVASGEDTVQGPWHPPQIVGFASGGRRRGGARDEGEIETLYVLDDYREQGVGRRLMRAAAAHLNAIGCRSVRLWVLRDNHSRWFYQHLGGRLVEEQKIRVGGHPVVQQALRWDPIGLLLAATAPKVN
jgi:ribosomal protein S18 acetylase RimI-like enzyme